MSSMPSVLYDFIELKGGLDLVTPTMSMRPGVARNSVNYEAAATSGYTRISGYERFDGRDKPSEASFVVLYGTFSPLPAAGDAVTGKTSGASAEVAYSNESLVVVTMVSGGTFASGEQLQAAGPIDIGEISLTSSDVSITNLQQAQFAVAAADRYRADIAAPAGSGGIAGVFYFGGTLYCFRPNAGNTAMVLLKSTASGWSAVAFEYEVSYTVGSGSVDEGDTLTQGGVTATVRRVLVRTGTLAAGSAVGTLVISAPAGGNFAAGAASTTGGGTLTLDGAQTAITLAVGGRFQTVSANFFGSVGTNRIYGCDGINTAWEFDGTYFVPIHTGMATDAPDNIAAHKNHLFLAFGSSLQFSSIGQPYTWSPILGAGEMATGDDITNLLLLPGTESGGAMAVYTRNNTHILYGSDSTDWNLVSFNAGLGALPYTAQAFGTSFVFDDRGIVTLNTSQSYGNFDASAVSYPIQPFITEHRTLVTASCVNRERSQYRVFFSDGWGIYLTMVNGKYMGAMPVYFPAPVTCVWEGEDGNGAEVTFFGSSNGTVYQLDVGPNFDGEAINAYITLNHNAIRSPRILKRYMRSALEVRGTNYATITFSYELGYGRSDISPPVEADYETNFDAAYWDDGGSWDDGGEWDGRTLLPTELEMSGTAENVSMTFSSNTNYSYAYTINSVIVHYVHRRGMR